VQHYEQNLGKGETRAALFHGSGHVRVACWFLNQRSTVDLASRLYCAELWKLENLFIQ